MKAWILFLLFPSCLIASYFFLYPDGFFVLAGNSMFLEIWDHNVSLGFSFEKEDVHYDNMILFKVKRGETSKKFAFSIGSGWSISMDLKIKTSFPTNMEMRAFYVIGPKKAFVIREGRSSIRFLGYLISNDYFSYISNLPVSFSKSLLKIPGIISVGTHSGNSIFSVGFADKGFFSGIGWFEGFCVDFGFWKDFNLKSVKGSLNIFFGISQKGLYPSFYLRVDDPFNLKVVYDEGKLFAGVEF